MAITAKTSVSATLYYGPSTSTYPADTTLAAGTSITILWKEDTWYYVEASSRRNYIQASQVTGITGGTPVNYVNLMPVRFVGTSGTCHLGPSTSYVSGDTLAVGTIVRYLSPKKEGDFAFVEYDSAGKKKRAWFEHMKIAQMAVRQAGSSGVVVRSAAAGSALLTTNDGDLMYLIPGIAPVTAALSGTTYTWYKVHYYSTNVTVSEGDGWGH